MRARQHPVYNMDFDSYKVPQLKRYLQDRGVTCHFYRRDHLLKLCHLAAELNLEVLNDETGIVFTNFTHLTTHQLTTNIERSISFPMLITCTEFNRTIIKFELTAILILPG